MLCIHVAKTSAERSREYRKRHGKKYQRKHREHEQRRRTRLKEAGIDIRKIPRSCIVCGLVFKVAHASRKQRFCSTSCSNRRATDLWRERFWKKVCKKEKRQCWEWTAGTDKDGYGRFWYGSTTVRAHRVAWCLVNERAFSIDLLVLHRCDNPRCCNPDHLFLGTHLDNVHDAITKGRR